MRLTYLVGAIVLILGLIGAFWRPIATHWQTVLLLSEELPQVPVKPLHWVSAPARHRIHTVEAQHGVLRVDVFLPTPRFGQPAPASLPALILLMGIRTREDDRVRIHAFADTLSRLDRFIYTVLRTL